MTSPATIPLPLPFDLPSITTASTLTGTVTAQSPTNKAAVSSNRPTFAVSVTAPGITGVFVRITVATNNLFTTGVQSIDTPALSVDGSNLHTTAKLSGTLSNGTYFWRAQLRLNGADLGLPTTARTLYVAAAATSTWIRGGLTVIDAATKPVLWFAHPASGQPGDTVVLYGAGLYDPSIIVILDGTPCTVTDQAQHVPATDYTATRRIDPDTGTVTVEHDEVVIVIPDITPPGGQLYVTGT